MTVLENNLITTLVKPQRNAHDNIDDDDYLEAMEEREIGRHNHNKMLKRVQGLYIPSVVTNTGTIIIKANSYHEKVL